MKTLTATPFTYNGTPLNELNADELAQMYSDNVRLLRDAVNIYDIKLAWRANDALDAVEREVERRG